MPSLTTHYIFADMVYKKLDKNVLETVDSKIYHTFAQSHDYLYYSFSKRLRKLGFIGHHEKTQDYLINIVKNIIDNNLQDNKECLGYLYGSITHYVLDTICHPYIFYKTGVYYKDDKERHKYIGGHTHIEKQLDAFYYKKYFNKEYHKANVSKEIIGNPKLSTNLKDLITKVYKETYNMDNVGQGYVRSIFENRFIISAITNDRFGIKYHILKFINLFMHSHPEYYSSYVKEPIYHYLNEEKKEWNNPCDKNDKYNYSFDELLQLSEKKCIEIINKCHECIYKTKDIEKLRKYIPDIDYANGYSCSDHRKMQYFEY